jgi:hypothetical protein
MQIFDYKLKMQEHRYRLWKRIADYSVRNPRVRVTDIARSFNVALSIVAMAMARNGVKRVRGCRTWHFPKGAAQAKLP